MTPAERKAAQRLRARARGRCLICCTAPARPGLATCGPCVDRVYFARNTRLAPKRANLNAIRAERATERAAAQARLDEHRADRRRKRDELRERARSLRSSGLPVKIIAEMLSRTTDWVYLMTRAT